MGSPSRQLSELLLEVHPHARVLSNLRPIRLDHVRYRGRENHRKYAFVYYRKSGSTDEHCGFAPGSHAHTSDELIEKLAMTFPGFVTITKGSLDTRMMAFEDKPTESTIEELVVRTFAALQRRDCGEFNQARLFLGDLAYEEGLSISEWLRLYGYIMPVCQ
jgi:hypothetical protein